MTKFAESVVEDAALAWLEGLGYEVLYGPGAERNDPNYRDVVLERQLRQTHMNRFHLTRPKAP
jgi:type I restriction enzyme R subunit